MNWLRNYLIFPGMGGGGNVFDSSAIKLPDLGGAVTSLPGKFSTSAVPRDNQPATAEPIG